MMEQQTMRRLDKRSQGARRRPAPWMAPWMAVWMAALWMAVMGLILAPLPLRAEDGGDAPPSRSPRVTVTVGEATVVLIATNDRLYAFVDRIDGNDPILGASLTVQRAGKRNALPLTEQAPGLFIGPFKRSTQGKDVFTLTLASPAGKGEQTATLVYDDDATGKTGGSGGGRALCLALLSALAGAGGGALAWRWWSRRARPAPAPPSAP